MDATARAFGYRRGVPGTLALSATLAALLLAAAAIWSVRAAFRRARRRHGADLLRQVNALNELLGRLTLPGPLPPFGHGSGRPDFLLEVARHALERRPSIVVECGSGLSTLVIARCLELNGTGRLWSLEHDADFARFVRGEAARLGLERLAVLDAPLVATPLGDERWLWYEPSGLPDGPIDMLVIDGPPGRVQPLARYPAGPILFPRLAADAVVLVDDARRGKERRVLARWAREFPALAREVRGTARGLAILTRGR